MTDLVDATREHTGPDTSPSGWRPPSPAPEPTPPPSQRGRLIAAVGVTALIASALGAGAGAVAARNDTSSSSAARAVLAPPAGTARAASPLDTASIVADTTPSVVSIRSTTTSTDIFQQQVTEQGTGTGFVASADGLIYTNAHVVADNETVEVTLADGSTKKGKVVGVDATDDLAVVKIDAKGLTPLPIGASADMHVGDPVVAVGNALALPGGPTATQGIVSALNRSIDTNNGEHLAKLIQTDAAINPGNSGGPLLNAEGQVIGINTAGASGAENVGFAIALDTAKPILDELAQGKPHLKAFLGVQTSDVSANGNTRPGVRVDHGAYVEGVTAESAADAAGVQVGDVITKIDGTTINTADDVGTVLRGHQPGDTITITVQRGSDSTELKATLGSHQA